MVIVNKTTSGTSAISQANACAIMIATFYSNITMGVETLTNNACRTHPKNELSVLCVASYMRLIFTFDPGLEILFIDL